MSIRFLIDENLSPRLKPALLRLEPRVDILYIGELGAPPLSTPDPDILQFLELTQRLLITDNRSSMPGHIADHLAAGGHFWGMCWLRYKMPIGRLAQELYLIWGASTPEEWLDRVEWIPF